MGYSVKVRAKNKELQKKMLEFMRAEYRPHWQIRPRPRWWPKNYQDCYSSPPLENSYSGRAFIEIAYNASGFERGYVFTLIRWMALQVGATRLSFKDPKVRFPEPVPFMVYEDEAWPVLCQSLSAVPKNLRWCCVDRFGMKLKFDENYISELPGANTFSRANAKARKRYGAVSQEDFARLTLSTHQKIQDARNRLLWPGIKKIMAPIRAEMKRLDKAWQV